MKIFQHIALFFIVSLFNVLFIPQHYLNTVQELSHANQASEDDLLAERSMLNIFEEESKEGREGSQLSGEGFLEGLNECIKNDYFRFLFFSLQSSTSGYTYFQYTSLILTPLSPPPDLG